MNASEIHELRRQRRRATKAARAARGYTRPLNRPLVRVVGAAPLSDPGRIGRLEDCRNARGNDLGPRSALFNLGFVAAIFGVLRKPFGKPL
jgi:hypothetical protein